jgi:hypothetical protein
MGCPDVNYGIAVGSIFRAAKATGASLLASTVSRAAASKGVLSVRHTGVAAMCGVLLAVTGCSAEGMADADRSSAPEPPTTTSGTSTPSPARVIDSVPDVLRLSLPAASVPAEGALDVDLMTALAAPTIDEEPVKRGMLLTQVSLFRTDVNPAIPSGQPYLMTLGGEWRQFDLGRYGFEAPTHGELSMALSPDGRNVALADPSGLVTVDLGTQAFRRFDLPVDETVALKWSADAASLHFRDRNGIRQCGPKGCVLDVATGDLDEASYEMFYSAPGAAGEVVEVQGWTRSRPARVVTHTADAPPTVTELAYRALPSTGGGPAAGRNVAFAQCSNNRKRRDENGVVVVEPSAGAVVALLSNSRGSPCSLGAQTWLTARHLIVSNWQTGDLWLWEVGTKSVSKVAISRTNTVNIDVAGEVMAQRLRGQLRR